MCSPCFWTGETMKPTQLPKILFGKKWFYGTQNEEVHLSAEDAGISTENKKRNTRSDWKGRRKMFDKLLMQLMDTFKENSGLELTVTWNKKKKDSADQIDYHPNRWCFLTWMFCKQSGSVARVQFACKEENAKYCFYLKLHEIYFHSCEREGEESKPSDLNLTQSEEGKGYYKLVPLVGMEKLIEVALKYWIAELHKHKHPNKSLPAGESTCDFSKWKAGLG